MRGNKSGGRRIRVRAIRRSPMDVQKLSRALIALAMAQAQAEALAQADHEARRKPEGKRDAA